MNARELFDQISDYVTEAEMTQNSSPLVDKVKALNLNIDGEVNYMNLNCSYQDQAGSSIKFSFRSYDPSGPFQNLPDVNKIEMQLFKNGAVISEINKRFDDKPAYG
jgi:hypothetical protein